MVVGVVMAMAVNQVTLSLVYALHMLATVIWIGGLLYQSIFLFPALRSIADPKIIAGLSERLRSRFQPIAWLSLAVLIGTGLIQMTTHPGYVGFLAIENTWSRAILIKHIVIGLMVGIAAYQSFVLYPQLTRSLILEKKNSQEMKVGVHVNSEAWLARLNLFFSVIVLIFTAIARAS
jgi:uncharacterized membrane protein